MKTQFDTFESYLLKIGILKVEEDYTYTSDQLYSHIEFFRKNYTDGITASKALEMLHFKIVEEYNLIKENGTENRE